MSYVRLELECGDGRGKGVISQSTYVCIVQSSVCRLPKYWSPTPSPPTEYVLPPPLVRGGYTIARRWGGGGSIFWKTPDIGLASYSIISLRVILWPALSNGSHSETTSPKREKFSAGQVLRGWEEGGDSYTPRALGGWGGEGAGKRIPAPFTDSEHKSQHFKIEIRNVKHMRQYCKIRNFIQC